MISKALQFTADVLDQFLKNRFGLDESRLVLNGVVEPNGNVPLINQNKIVMSLVNIEKETNKPFYVQQQRLSDGSYSEFNPDERFNLLILISANFDKYVEALKFLDGAILFFQINVRLDASRFSNMPPGLQKLEFELEKVNYHQMHGLWTAMGAKYQPSMIYKVRLVTYQGQETKTIVPAVNNTSNAMA
jgi:hypothetical protein